MNISDMFGKEFPFTREEFCERHKITDQQLKFIIALSNTGKPKEAAIEAGYSLKSAPRLARKVMAHPKVNSAYQELIGIGMAKQGWGPDCVGKIAEQLIEVYERCMQSREVKDRHGKPTGEYRFDSNGALRALELLGKHNGMFVDRIKVENNDPAELINEGAARAREARKKFMDKTVSITDKSDSQYH